MHAHKVPYSALKYALLPVCMLYARIQTKVGLCWLYPVQSPKSWFRLVLLRNINFSELMNDTGTYAIAIINMTQIFSNLSMIALYTSTYKQKLSLKIEAYLF